MPVYDAKTIPSKVGSTIKDPEIAEWMKTGPVLGAHKPIHVQRREHDAFIDKNPPQSAESNTLAWSALMERSRSASTILPSPAPHPPQL